MSLAMNFDHSYARLPAQFYARCEPTPVAAPRLLRLNRPLAESLGLDPDALDTKQGADVFAGNVVPPGAEPIALAYAGHQFGGFSPRLGDGRAILLGEIITPSGERRDLQLKGAGPTPYSRRGDGRAAIGPVLREYLISEAMAAFGIPTTRCLAATATGEMILRETPLPGAVVTRIAASHLRIGTFEYFAARGETELVRILVDYAIARHDPDLAGAPTRYAEFLARVIARQARLIADWMRVGFIHGVMNTDNMAISGETIDYGPCAFLDAYHPATVFSSIDHGGRYAYGNQPRIAHWNLARLAEALLPLLAPVEAAAIEIAQTALAEFAPAFDAAYHTAMRAKLGLTTAHNGDAALIATLMTAMQDEGADFTITFRALNTLTPPPFLSAWAPAWLARMDADPAIPSARAGLMRTANPAYIPRNHRVEAALHAAASGDLAPFEALLQVITHPYDARAEYAPYALPPAESERVLHTFCGT